MPNVYEIYHVGPVDKTNTQYKTIHQTEKVINTLRPGLGGDNHLLTAALTREKPLPQRGLSGQSMASNDNLTTSTKRQNT